MLHDPQHSHLTTAFSPNTATSSSPATTASSSSSAYRISTIQQQQQQNQQQNHNQQKNQHVQIPHLLGNAQQSTTVVAFEETSNNNSKNSFLDFQSTTSNRISPPVPSRMIQGMPNADKMKPAIQAYLHADDPVEVGEQTVIIMTSKVAQKSYGTEKR